MEFHTGIPRFFSMIISSEISAGEMPGMRDACPSDRGLMRVNFSMASFRKAAMAALVKFSGMYFFPIVKALHLLFLPVEISLVFEFDFDRFAYILGQGFSGG